VLVRDCLWRYLPDLADVQWLHDPAATGSLATAEAVPGALDALVTRICTRLVDVLPSGPAMPGPSPPAPGATAEIPAGPVAAGAVAGELHGVPGLPTGYLRRDELTGLIEAVLADDAGAVGMTEPAPAVGLRGSGGVGKSVLAAALARDPDVRRRFPDGVHWVDVGEQADVLAVQLGLLARLDQGPPPASPAGVPARLRELLADRGVLLVVDDVWTDAAAHGFLLTGPRGRVLFTTRDPQVLTAVRARIHPVDVLGADAAAALAAAVLGIDAADLPPDAAAAVDAVGRTALGVSLLAAAVGSGRSWRDVAEALRGTEDVYGDHPYANTFRALRVAFDALPRRAGRRAAGSGGVPARHPHPGRDRRPAVGAHPPPDPGRRRPRPGRAGHGPTAHPRRRVGEPARPATRVPPAAGPAAGRSARPAAGRLPRLLPEPAAWSALPAAESYLGEHLAGHLRGAGARRELVATATDPAYLATRIARGGVHGAESDLATAAATVPDHPDVAWWRSWLPRHAGLLAQSSGAVPATLHAWLTADRSRPAHVDPDRLAPLLSTPRLTARWGLPARPDAQVRVVKGAGEPVASIAWSPNDGVLAAACGHALRLWDVSTGLPVLQVDNSAPVRAVAWSAVGGLATGDTDGTITTWDPATGAATATASTTGPVTAIAWSPTGHRLAAAAAGGRVLVWEPATGHRLDQTSGEPAEATIAWSPGGVELAVASTRQVDLWDLRTDATTRLFPLGDGYLRPPALAWSPDDRHLAVGMQNGLLFWRRGGGRTAAYSAGHLGQATGLAWSPDGAKIVAAYRGATVVWDVLAERAQGDRPPTVLDLEARDLRWSPAGRLAVATRAGEVSVWEVRDHEVGTGADDHAQDLSWSANTGLLAGRRGPDVVLWDPATGDRRRLERSFKVAAGGGRTGHTVHSPRTLSWSADGRHLAAGYGLFAVVWDVLGTAAPASIGVGEPHVEQSEAGKAGGHRARRGTRRLYRAAEVLSTTRPIGTLGVLSHLAWSPVDGTLAVAAGRRVVLWEPDEVLTTPLIRREGRAAVAAAIWSPTGNSLSAYYSDGEVRLWDRDYPDVLVRTSPIADLLRSPQRRWSPDGRTLGAPVQGGVALYDVERDVRRSLTLPGIDEHPAPTLVWSADGRLLAVLAERPHVVDVASGAVAWTGDQRATRASWSTGSTALAIATADDTVAVLGADTGAELARLPVGFTIDTIAVTTTTIAVGGHTGIAVLDLVLDPP
jgi:WD40 repeat protein